MKRLEEAEKTIAELRRGQMLAGSGAVTSPGSLPAHDDPSTQTQSMPSGIHSLPETNINRLSTDTPSATILRGIPSRPLILSGLRDNNRSEPHDEAKESMATELSVDEHGKINYYGPTSAVHEPPQPHRVDPPKSPTSPTSTRASEHADIRASLAAHARETATWEEFALGNASLQTGIPRQLIAKLLHIHWAWISPMFMWVYKPAFIRRFSFNCTHSPYLF